jgi:hypothetical protein
LRVGLCSKRRGSKFVANYYAFNAKTKYPKNKLKRFYAPLNANLLNLANILKREGVGMSNFTTTTGHFFHNIKNGFVVDHYYNITTSKMAF